MALVRSRSTDLFPHGPVPSTTRQLQEALYTHLDDLEKTAFIEALSLYGTRRDIFELVNSLRKTLNTPVKRQLFPLVRQVIRKGDVDAFDLLTRGDTKQNNTMPRPYLYRPHMADLNVMKKQKAATMSRSNRHDTSSESDLLPSAASAKSPNAKRGGSHDRKSRSRSPRSLTRRRYDDDIPNVADRNPSLAQENEGELIEIDLGTPGEDRSGYGFTIRGGQESGLGMYVSSVDHGGTAHRCGLKAGDLIVEANNINFRSISHDEAALLIQASTCLNVLVSRVGKIPGCRNVHETYRWTDPRGRPVSPPGGWDPQGSRDGFLADDEGRTRSGSLMLKGNDERKVNVVVERGQGLGLMVRGGREYGLGIYVSSIDRYSVAENSGLKIGDQILDVNGRSLLDVTHAQAVRQLKSGRHLMMTVKDVGKVPFAKTTIDQTGWIESTRVNSYARSVSSRPSESGSPTNSSIFEGFKRGAGSRLMPTSLTTGQQQKELIYDQAKLLLNDSEQMTLNYYVTEYEKRTINLTGFTQALHRILNTPAKLTLLSEIRTVILPKELNIFDQIVLNRELDNSLSEARGHLAPDVISIGSYDSHEVKPQARRTMFSQAFLPQDKTHTMEKMNNMDLHNYDLQETSRRLGGSASSLTKLRDRPSRRNRSPSPVSAYHLMASGRTLPENTGRGAKGSNHKKADEPSDDSGVEINGQLATGSPEYRHTSGTKTKLYTANNKKYSSPQKKILSHLQSANRGDGAGNQLANKDTTSSVSRRQQRHQLTHRALVHQEFDADHDSVTGSSEELRFVGADGGTADDDVNEKGRERRKGVMSPQPSPIPPSHQQQHQRRLHERSRSLQRGGQRLEGRPKSRARSSDPGLSRGQMRYESDERDKDTSLERHFQGQARHDTRERHSSRERHNSRERQMSQERHSSRERHASRERHNSRERHASRERHNSRERHTSQESRGQHHATEDIYATVNKRRRGRSKSPVTVDMKKAWAAKNNHHRHGMQQQNNHPAPPSPHWQDYGNHPNNHQIQSSSSSTMVNSHSKGSVAVNGQSSASSTLKSRGGAGQGKQTITFNTKGGGTGTGLRSRANDNRKKAGVSYYDNATLLTVPSSSLTPPLGRSPQDNKNHRHQQQQQHQYQQQQQQQPRDEAENYQLPSKDVLQKLSKSYRSVSPRRPHRSPKISAHSVTSRKRLDDTGFFRSSNREPEEEDHPSSYPASSVESTPRGTFQHSSAYPQHSRSATRSALQPKQLQLNARNLASQRSNGNSRVATELNNKSNVSVPLIKINSKVLPKVDAAFMKSSIRSRNSSKLLDDGTHDRSADRVTISEIPIEINASNDDFGNNSYASEGSHYSNTSSNFNSINTTNITINKPGTGTYRPSLEAVKKKASERYGDIPLEVIYIYRSKPTLGVAIEGGANTRQPLPKVINVQPGGSAFESGGLKVGHVILEVNGKPAVGLSHLDAARLIAEAFKDKDKNRMELLVTDWFDELLDVIKVEVEFLKVNSK